MSLYECNNCEMDYGRFPFIYFNINGYNPEDSFEQQKEDDIFEKQFTLFFKNITGKDNLRDGNYKEMETTWEEFKKWLSKTSLTFCCVGCMLEYIDKESESKK